MYSLTDPLTAAFLTSCLPVVRFPAGVLTSHRMSQQLNLCKLLPEEMTCTRQFSDKRLVDFRLGRACARDLLTSIGMPDFPILVGESRQPIWPASWVGSISHADNIALCAIASTTHLSAIGIDIESIKEESFDLWSIVASEQEQRRSADYFANCHYLAKLLFSAKESIFKCQFPLTGRWLDFKDISLELNFQNHTYVSTIVNGNEYLRISGAWDANETYIVTTAWIGCK